MAQAHDGEELVVYWTLLPAEAALVGGKRGPARLGFAVLLKFFQREGRFPQRPQDVHPPWWPTSRRRWRYRSRNGAPMIGMAARSNIIGQQFGYFCPTPACKISRDGGASRTGTHRTRREACRGEVYLILTSDRKPEACQNRVQMAID